MSNITSLVFILFISLNLLHPVSCRKKSWGSKSLKKLSKSEVQVKTFLFPCNFDKEGLNSTFGSTHHQLRNCKRKFVIKMTVNSGGEFSSKTDGFIPINHVIDGITGRKKRLLTPLMVRLKREKMYQLYDLQLIKSVNAEAREEVINHENTPNYTGCDTSSSHPTCGFSFFNNKIIQFSEGFCCSCDQNKNDLRQPCDGGSHEIKDFPNMEYAVHHRRSNRTSRDLEMTRKKNSIDEFVTDTKKDPVSKNNITTTQLSSQLMNKLSDSKESKRNVSTKIDIASEKYQNKLSQLPSQNVKITGKEPLGDVNIVAPVRSLQISTPFSGSNEMQGTKAIKNFTNSWEFQDKNDKLQGQNLKIDGKKSNANLNIYAPVLSSKSNTKLTDPNEMQGSVDIKNKLNLGHSQDKIGKFKSRNLQIPEKQPNVNENIGVSILSSPIQTPFNEESIMEGNAVINNYIDSGKPHTKSIAFVNKNALQLDAAEAFKPVLNDELWKNVTVKSFEFESSNNVGLESISPKNIALDSEDKMSENRELLDKISEINYSRGKLSSSKMDPANSLASIEGEINEYCDSFKEPENDISALDREQCKILLMKRIKEDKSKEMNLGGNNSLSCESNINSEQFKINSNDSCFKNIHLVNKKGKKGFSLKIENENSELRLRIVTKRPKSASLNRGTSKKQKCTKATTKKADKAKTCTSSEHTTKKAMKQRILPKSFLKFFKSGKNKTKTTTVNPKCTTKNSCNTLETTSRKEQTEYTECPTKTKCFSGVTEKETKSLFLPISNVAKIKTIDLRKKSGARNITDMEGLMYKLIPVINTVQNMKSSGHDKFADGTVADTDNQTYKVYIELKKKSDKVDENQLKKSSVQNKFLTNLESKENEIQQQVILHPNHQIVSSKSNGEINNEMEDQKEFSKLQLAGSKLRLSDVLGNQVPSNRVQFVQKREASCDTQIRGGQKCSKKGKLPCNSNAETYFESAHCLRFSDLWFNVFKLLNPRLENAVTVKIYAKHQTPDKRVCWENLTKRLPGRVGTINEILIDDAKTIMITYSSDDKVAYNLDCLSDYLLVPQPLPSYCKNSELKILSYAGPEEYLVLKDKDITFDGDECDKAGVNYAAFARQAHRCQQEAGSCLRNQPLQLWRKDKEAEKSGKSGGHYFLKHFLEVTDQSVLQNTTSNQAVLRAPYYEKYQSQVVIEMNADHVDIIGDKTEGQITEVYTDATSDKSTVVKVVVTNLGVAADYFGVDFANCTSRLGPSDFDKPGKDEIPPQHRITYTATISSPLKSKRVECKMVLYNVDHQVIASRRIIIVQSHRCMCVWYCQCVCHNYPDPGLPCIPLSLAEYNRAGFPGHLPVTTGSNCSTFFTVLHAVLWFFSFLLLFGLMKAVFGLCFSTIGLWGLWYLLPDEARSLQSYLEPQYACCPVARDCDGFPIHPRTYRRTDVHFLPWYSEFIVNVFFFVFAVLSCLCDHGTYKHDSSGFYYQEPTYRGRSKCCSPGCTVRNKSPCGSICSTRRNRRFRMSAGAEEEFLNPNPQLLKDDEWAKRLVDELTRSYVVFRVLTRPMGGVKSVPGTPYCVRGFFQESENGIFEFAPPSPLMQIWQMDGSPLEPPLRLDPTPFHALYRSAREVLGAHELSPWARGVVINAP